jgi:hypothetical protein
MHFIEIDVARTGVNINKDRSSTERNTSATAAIVASSKLGRVKGIKGSDVVSGMGFCALINQSSVAMPDLQHQSGI